MNLFNIKGKVAIVTGGTGVLGGSMAKGLARAGVKVGILGRRKENAEAIANEIIKEGGEAIALPADVLDENQLTTVRDVILKKWGSIDILVNAAGGNMPGATVPPGKTIFDLSTEDFKRVIDLNLMGTVIPTMIFSKAMTDNKSGVIINISSMAAQQAITRVVGYSSSKAAIDNFTKWMSVEMATKYGEGIRVNAIAPGFFIGEQNRKLLTNEDGSLTDRGKTIIAKTPMKRFGASDELNGTLIWLCSDASKFITGIVVPVDGGFSAFSGV
jgi:NAD(P)-dependent dehydrogenase (short-subunit alcohol dehydrogenase family)